MNTDFMPVYRNFIDTIFMQGDYSWPKGQSKSFEIDFINQTRSDGIQLLLYDKVAQTHHWNHWPEAIRSTLAATAQNDAIVDTLRQQDFVMLHKELRTLGIQPILLKGAALSLTHYAASFLRPRSDTDFMIPEDSFPRVRKILLKLGYKSEIPTGKTLGHYQLTFSKSTDTGIRVLYDIHWKLFNPEIFACTLSYNEMLEHSIDFELLGEQVRLPSNLHALLHACVHLTAHHAHEEKLVWLYDIHLLANPIVATRYESFLTLARQKEVSQLCAKALRAAKETYGTKISEEQLYNFQAQQATEKSAAFPTTKPTILSIFISNWKFLKGKDKIKLLWEHLFPSEEFMLDKYKTRKRLRLPWLYLKRIAEGIPKILKPLKKTL